MVILERFVMLLFARMLPIVIQMVYVLEQIIVHALLDGKIQIAVFSTVIMKKIVHIHKEHVLDLINVIVHLNGQEVIVIVQCAIQLVL